MVRVTSRRAVGVGSVGRLCVVYTGRTAIADEEWTEHLANLKATTHLMPSGNFVNITCAPFGGPNAKQRRQFGAAAPAMRGDDMSRSALLSQSTVVRSIVTAMSWFSKSSSQLRAFREVEFREALAWLREAVEFDPMEGESLLFQIVRSCGDDPQKLGIPQEALTSRR